jgi:hypothetical protein
MVKRTGLGYECTVCHQRIACGPDKKPIAIIVQSSSKPTTHRVLVDGVEVHRCWVTDVLAQQNRGR